MLQRVDVGLKVDPFRALPSAIPAVATGTVARAFSISDASPRIDPADYRIAQLLGDLQ